MIRPALSCLILAATLPIAAYAAAYAGDVNSAEAPEANVVTKISSLEQAINAALESEPQLRASAANVGMAQARLKSTQAEGKSHIGINGTYGVSHAEFGPASMMGRTGYANIYPHSLAIAWERRLYDGGASLARVSEADFALAAQNGEYANARNQLIVNVVSAYFEVAIATQNTQLARDNLAAIERFTRDAALMFKAGVIPVSEKAGAEARLAQAQYMVAAADARLIAANAALLRLSNCVADNPVWAAKAPQLPASEAEARAYALANHPLLAANNARVAAAKAMVRVAGSGYMPQVSAQVRAANISNQFLPNYKQNEVGAYLSFSVPLYSSGQIAAGVSQAKYGLEAARDASDAATRNINMEITQAYAAYHAALAQTAAAQAALSARQIAMNSVEAEMRAGARPLADVLEAQKNLTEAKLESATANAAIIVAKYKITAAIGGDLMN